MVLQGCKSTLQESRPIESGHGRHAVQVANVCSYKLIFQSWCELGWFLHGHAVTYVVVQKGGQVTKPIMHGCEIAILLNYCVHVF